VAYSGGRRLDEAGAREEISRTISSTARWAERESGSSAAVLITTSLPATTCIGGRSASIGTRSAAAARYTWSRKILCFPHSMLLAVVRETSNASANVVCFTLQDWRTCWSCLPKASLTRLAVLSVAVRPARRPTCFGIEHNMFVGTTDVKYDLARLALEQLPANIILLLGSIDGSPWRAATSLRAFSGWGYGRASFSRGGSGRS
jgi:hypothetical protein